MGDMEIEDLPRMRPLSPDSSTIVPDPKRLKVSKEDMDLIEVLWKQDVDLGFSLVDPIKNAATSSKKESEDDIEKLKALEAINGSDDKKEIKEEPEKEEDPWAGLSYTIDLETGEYILNSAESVGCSSSSSDLDPEQLPTPSAEPQPPEPAQQRQPEPLSEDQDRSEHLLGFGEDSLGFGELDDDFRCAGLLDDADCCLLDGCDAAAVDGLLNNDSLGLPDGFNLEEALQLVGLDEVELEKKPEVKKKKKKASREDKSDGARSDSESDEDEPKGAAAAAAAEEEQADNMIHTPQYHHPHHPHHRSFQSRVPFVRTMSMDQRWPDIAPFFPTGSGAGGSGSDAFAHPGASAVGPHAHHHHHHHHHHHPSYTSLGGTGHSYESTTAQRNVLLHNATLAPPVGDLNSTGAYHNTGGPSNLGTAVAQSMNLTNSSEPMGGDNGAAYKSEPTDMMYYPNTTTDNMNQTTDSIFSALLDEQLGWNNEDLAFNVGDGLYGSGSGATGAAGTLPGVQAGAGGGGMNQTGAGASAVGAAAAAAPAGPQTSLGDERMDASSDSAVSSMGSERVPSLSDGEWMETGSNSSHTQADSHYSMDYNGKYRMPYDCGYTLPTTRSSQRGSCQAAERGGLAPVAQKKHHMFGKRCFQEQGPIAGAASGAGSPLSAATAHHPSVTPLKYDYEGAQSVASGPPGQAYSGPIEGAAGPQAEMKYSCSVDFARQQSGRSSLEHVHHNHTYHLPPESTGSLQRPISRDKKARKSEADEHLTRDEKRARALNVPIPVSDIINLPMDEFNERLSKYDLSEAQLSLIRDIRRRGKNKVAAQNCRKRKLDQINSLSDEVKEMRNRKMRLLSERNFMLQESARVKEKFGQLYRHIFHSLRDPEGHPYNTMEYSLQLSADGNVVMVPRSNQANNGHYTRSTMDPTKGKPDNNHHHHQEHKE